MMKLSRHKIIIIFAVFLVIVMGLFNVANTFGEDESKMDKLVGTWWTYDPNQTPWAIQFNKDGTFRAAQTVLRLDRFPQDEGQFLIEGTSLTLISDTSCKGSCKGLKGKYEVEFPNSGILRLKEQQDQCEERTSRCTGDWTKVWP